MNANQAKEWLPFIQAVADGKTIQISMSGGWVDISDVLGYLDCGVEHLRIKPREFKTFSLPWEYIDKRWNFATYANRMGMIGRQRGIIVSESRPVPVEDELGLSWTGGGMTTWIEINPIDENVNHYEYLACRNPDDQP